jgi:sortase B
MDRGRRYRQTPLAKKKKRVPFRRWVLLALIAVFAISAWELTAYFIRSHNNRTEQARLAAQHEAALTEEQAAARTPEANAVSAQTSVTATEATPLQEQAASPAAQKAGKDFFQVIGVTQDSLKPFVRQNGDTVGWLTIEGIVDLPVVYRDNAYYLTHDFNGNRNANGALFLDEYHPLRANSQNLLIYGHNMKDESMFGKLAKYMKGNFLHSHYAVRLETRIESFTYLVFAAELVSTETGRQNYLCFWGHPSFADDEAFSAYIDAVYGRSLYTRYLDVDASDTLLTMATCYGDDRLVLVARRQRPDETEKDIQRALLGLYRK